MRKRIILEIEKHIKVLWDYLQNLHKKKNKFQEQLYCLTPKMFKVVYVDKNIIPALKGINLVSNKIEEVNKEIDKTEKEINECYKKLFELKGEEK